MTPSALTPKDSPSASDTGGWWWPFVAYSVALLGLCLPLRGGRLFAFRDLIDYAIPHKLFSIAELRQFRLPLWNPFDNFGFPHLANLQSGVLYPVNLLLLLPFPVGLNASILVHFAIAATGLFALARAWRMSRLGAIVGGFAYGFSPYLLSLTDLNAFLFTSAWLPWLLVVGHRLGGCPGPMQVVTTAMVFALAFLAGEPQTFLFGAIVAFLVSVSSTVDISLRRSLRLLVAWSGAALLTVLLVAPVLLPFIELMSTTERAGEGLTREQVYRYSLEPVGLITLLAPGIAGDVVQGTHWLGSQTYVRMPYVGVGVVTLAIVGLLTRSRRAVLFGALGVGALLLALGPAGGLYPILFAAGFRQSRFPVKFLIFTILALAVLAALGVELLRARPVEARRPLLVTLGLLLTGAMALFVVLPAAAATAAAVHVAVVAATGLLLVAVAPAVVTRHGVMGRGTIVVAGVSIGVLDLLVASSSVLTTMPAADYLAPTELISRATAESRTAGCGWPRTFNPPVTEDSLAFVYAGGRHDERSLDRRKSLLFGNLNLLFGLATVRGGESAEIRWASDVVELLDRGPVARRLVDRIGASQVISRGTLEPFGFHRTAEVDSVALYANPTAGPQVFLAQEVSVESDSAIRRSRLLEQAAGHVVVEAAVGAMDARCGERDVRATTCTPHELRFEVDGGGRCLLVVTDTWFPGWRAEVDGVESPVVRVDHAFRGVVIEPGDTSIRMWYQPRSLWRGAALGAIGLLLAMALLVAEVLARRKQERGSAGRAAGL